MKRTPKYVGLDVHQATTVASVREESGRVLACAVVPTEEVALLEFFGTMRGSVHVAFEEGTQAQWLHDLLKPKVHRVVVCDRRGEKRPGNKGDFVDADQISQDLLRGALRAVYHGSGHPRGAQGTGPHLRECRGGHHAHHAAAQGTLPRAGDPHTGARRLPAGSSWRVAGQAL
jgi:hypothetical protein